MLKMFVLFVAILATYKQDLGALEGDCSTHSIAGTWWGTIGEANVHQTWARLSIAHRAFKPEIVENWRNMFPTPADQPGSGPYGCVYDFTFTDFYKDRAPLKEYEAKGVIVVTKSERRDALVFLTLESKATRYYFYDSAIFKKRLHDYGTTDETEETRAAIDSLRTSRGLSSYHDASTIYFEEMFIKEGGYGTPIGLQSHFESNYTDYSYEAFKIHDTNTAVLLDKDEVIFLENDGDWMEGNSAPWFAEHIWYRETDKNKGSFIRRLRGDNPPY